MDTADLKDWKDEMPRGWDAGTSHYRRKTDASLLVPIGSTTDKQITEAMQKGYYVAYTDGQQTWLGSVLRRIVCLKDAQVRYDLVFIEAEG